MDTYQYDAYGNEIQQTDADDRTIQYQYNGLNELLQENWIGSDGTTVVQSTTYTYDAAGRLTSAVDPNAAYSYQYYDLNDLTTVDHQATVDGTTYTTPGESDLVLSYGYNGLGQRTSVSDNYGGTTNYGYSPTTGQLTSETLWVGGEPTNVNFQYDAAGRLQTQSDSAAGSATIRTAYGYNSLNQITWVTDTSSSTSGTTTLASYAYTYEPNGWLYSYTGPDGQQIYSYDADGELTGDQTVSASAASYSYDANGNRTSAPSPAGEGGGEGSSSSYSTGADNLVTSDGTYNYTYDADGNRTTATNIATGAVTTYTWDYHNQMTDARTVDASGVLLSDEKFTYDMFGQLIADSLDATGSGSYVTTYTVYDTSSLPQPGRMANNVYADFSGSGSLETRYLTGPALDQVFAQIAANGTTTWNLTDSQGSVRQVVDTSGSVLDTIDYDAYGNITSESNASAASRFKYDGMAWDAALGLYLDHARAYDPADGVFISQDPLSFAGGQSNLSEYVGNGPTDGSDLTGLAEGSDVLQYKGILSDWGVQDSFDIHHIFPQQFYQNSDPLSSFLGSQGFQRDSASNLIALPNRASAANGISTSRTLHLGSHTAVSTLNLQKRLSAVQSLLEAKAICPDVARQLIAEIQASQRQGLRTGQIQIQRPLTVQKYSLPPRAAAGAIKTPGITVQTGIGAGLSGLGIGADLFHTFTNSAKSGNSFTAQWWKDNVTDPVFVMPGMWNTLHQDDSLVVPGMERLQVY